jgi:ATP-dependent RNA helicase SUPV3L1/SUV3
LVEHFGIIPRRQIADDVKALAQEDRALLRKHGVRFGQHFIFMPALLKPAPTRLRLLLWSLQNEHDVFSDAPPPGHVTVPAMDAAPQGYYEMAGYRKMGARALRIDMLERLADMIRQQDARAGFEATQDMLSITGCTLEQFADLMGGLGFAAEKGERPKMQRAPEAKSDPKPKGGEAEATPEGAATEETPAPDAEDSASEAVATTVAEAPAQGASAEEAAEPASDVQADAASDTAESSEASSETPAETGEADASDTAEAETTTDGTAEAAPETEVFFTFKLKPRGRPQHARNRGSHGQGEAGSRDGQGQRPRGKGKGPGQGKFKGKKGKGDRNEDRPRKHSSGPKRDDKKIDPDNPFAVLQQLKNK